MLDMHSSILLDRYTRAAGEHTGRWTRPRRAGWQNTSVYSKRGWQRRLPRIQHTSQCTRHVSATIQTGTYYSSSVQDTSRLQYKLVRITHPVHKTRLSYNTDRYILLTQCTRLVSATIQTGTYYLPSVQDLSQLQYRPARTIYITVCKTHLSFNTDRYRRITYVVYKTRLSFNTDRYVLLTQCTRHVSATIQTDAYYLPSVQDSS